jgi:hypothetical protein
VYWWPIHAGIGFRRSTGVARRSGAADPQAQLYNRISLIPQTSTTILPLVGCGGSSWNVLGPVLGVDVMAKRSQGWVKCEDRLPYYRGSSCSLPLPRLHDHNSTTREDLAAGAGAPGVQGPPE